MIEKIELPKLNNKNTELLNELMTLSFSDLKELRKIHFKNKKGINEEIGFKKHIREMDKIDKLELNKYVEKFNQLVLIIDEAKRRKYVEIFNKVII